MFDLSQIIKNCQLSKEELIKIFYKVIKNRMDDKNIEIKDDLILLNGKKIDFRTIDKIKLYKIKYDIKQNININLNNKILDVISPRIPFLYQGIFIGYDNIKSQNYIFLINGIEAILHQGSEIIDEVFIKGEKHFLLINNIKSLKENNEEKIKFYAERCSEDFLKELIQFFIPEFIVEKVSRNAGEKSIVRLSNVKKDNIKEILSNKINKIRSIKSEIREERIEFVAIDECLSEFLERVRGIKIDKFNEETNEIFVKNKKDLIKILGHHKRELILLKKFFELSKLFAMLEGENEKDIKEIRKFINDIGLDHKDSSIIMNSISSLEEIKNLSLKNLISRGIPNEIAILIVMNREKKQD